MTYLLRLQIADDGIDVDKQLVDKGHDLANLNKRKICQRLIYMGDFILLEQAIKISK